jgi:hypothetical protein
MDDNGKTGQTVNVIQKVVQVSKEGEDKGDDQKQQRSTNKPTSPTSPVQVPLTQAPASAAPSPQPQLGPLDMLLVHGGRYIIDYALGPGAAATIDRFAEDVIAASPFVSKVFALLTATDISLRTVNNDGPSQAIQTLNALFNTDSDPNLLQKVGQVAALYQTGDDISAAHTTNIVANKLSAGINPIIAIEETPIPEPEISFATAGGTEPLSAGELEVKSLPAYYEDTTVPIGNGSSGIVEPPSEVVPESAGSEAAPDRNPPTEFTIPEGDPIVPIEPELPSEEPFILDPSKPEVSPFIPGFGLSSQPVFEEQITSLPPEETIVEGQPITTTQPTSTLDECLVNPELCYEPTQQLSVDICQEQPDLPQCMQAAGEDTDIEYYDISGENTALSYFDEDIGGYQQEELDYGDENSGEEDDYEEVGGYNAAEEDNSKEEDTGDEEDDYEEVGGYQEEEEQYSEEEEVSEEEEDFSEEEEESVEYYEE